MSLSLAQCAVMCLKGTVVLFHSAETYVYILDARVRVKQSHGGNSELPGRTYRI